MGITRPIRSCDVIEKVLQVLILRKEGSRLQPWRVRGYPAVGAIGEAHKFWWDTHRQDVVSIGNGTGEFNQGEVPWAANSNELGVHHDTFYTGHDAVNTGVQKLVLAKTD
ncbi:unnamed protein product [Ranitomeya imitator]|uniref:Uncharacterized protein n=1 Tax=Ranitomeya imitator TaxID=111125 RepID=A0ABN9MLC3_9NEOB|nr:unnamed protein product [Ranitomeya imitator]